MAVGLWCAAVGGAALAADGDVQLARLTPDDVQPSRIGPMPEPLSVEDEGRYRLLFALQDQARWREADRIIARLGDRLLLGHVLAQRYLSPKGYRASYAELDDWLHRFGDHPEAVQLYKLAMARKPEDAPAPPDPVQGYLGGHGQELRMADADTTAAAHRLLASGIAAWRQHAYDRAAAQFARVASMDGAAGEDIAAGAFWAARAQMVLGHPRRVEGFLRTAADFER